MNVLNKIDKKRFLKPLDSFKIYWKAYGGYQALLYSMYLWLSLALALCVTAIPALVTSCNKWDWSSTVLSIVPSVLGFSLGGYAILIGFGGEKFVNLLIKTVDDDGTSQYMKVNAAFLHFIFIQFLCIIYASIFKLLDIQNIFIYFFGILFFFYSLFTIMSTAFIVLNIADSFEAVCKEEEKVKGEKGKEEEKA